MGLSHLLCVHWLLAWNVVSQTGLGSYTPSEWASWYALPGAICLSNFCLCGLLHLLEITQFTMMGCPPFLLSYKRSQFLSLITPRFLAHETEHVIGTSRKAIDPHLSKRKIKFYHIRKTCWVHTSIGVWGSKTRQHPYTVESPALRLMPP